MARDARQTDPKRHTMTAPPDQIPGLDGRSPLQQQQPADKPRERGVSGVSVKTGTAPVTCQGTRQHTPATQIHRQNVIAEYFTGLEAFCS